MSAGVYAAVQGMALRAFAATWAWRLGMPHRQAGSRWTEQPTVVVL